MSRVVVLTNATEYAGPPTVRELAGGDREVFCHDGTFADPGPREEFERANPGTVASAAQEPEQLVEQALARYGRIDALISNDIPRGGSLLATGDDRLQGFESYIDSLLLRPARLLRAALPTMKAASAGSIVLVTSGTALCNPAVAAAHGYTTGRAGAHGLVRSLAPELAPIGIQINAVAPYYVYSQTFFPSELGQDDPKFVPVIDERIPMKRFGRPEELGPLIALLANGASTFVTGQVIAFSGGAC